MNVQGTASFDAEKRLVLSLKVRPETPHDHQRLLDAAQQSNAAAVQLEMRDNLAIDVTIQPGASDVEHQSPFERILALAAGAKWVGIGIMSDGGIEWHVTPKGARRLDHGIAPDIENAANAIAAALKPAATAPATETAPETKAPESEMPTPIQEAEAPHAETKAAPSETAANASDGVATEVQSEEPPAPAAPIETGPENQSATS